MFSTCQVHKREITIYDLTLHQSICERCALFLPAYQGHTFLELAQLPQHSHSLYSAFTKRLAELALEQESSGITCKTIRETCQGKIDAEVALINEAYDQMVRDIEAERLFKIEQAERQIKMVAEDSKKSMKTLLQPDYLQLKRQSQAMKGLLEESNFSELCKELSNPSLKSRLDTIEKDLQIIRLQFTNKVAFACHDSPFFMPLPPTARQQSIKEENLIDEIDNEFVNMFDSLRYSRVSEKSVCKTEISFCSFPTSTSTDVKKPAPSLRDSVVSLQGGLHVLKVHSKGDIKSLYIKNNIKTISMCHLDLNNREAFDALKKCCSNSFVSKLDFSDNQLTQKFMTQLKREKVQSKYLKMVIAKGMRMDVRELKKQGLNVVPGPNGSSTVQIGDITVQF